MILSSGTAFAILLAIILFVLSTILFFSISLNTPHNITIKFVLGYYLVACWSFVAIIRGELPRDIAKIMPVLLVLLFLFSTQFIILSIRPLNKMNALVEFFLILGWVAMGILVAQLIDPEVQLVIVSSNYYFATLVPELMFILFIRGIFILYLIFLAIHRFRIDGTKKRGLLWVRIGAVLTLASFLSIPLHMMVADFVTNEANALIFFASRLMISIGVLLFFIGLMKNKKEIIGAMQGINTDFIKKQVPIALFSYGISGIEVKNFHGFDFIEEDDELFIFLLTLGTAAITVLGRGEEYIEGSAIIPIGKEEELTAIVFTKWICDKKQQDPRFNGKSFLALLIAVERKLEWLVSDRKLWEQCFECFMEKFVDISEITMDHILEFAKEGMIEVIFSK